MWFELALALGSTVAGLQRRMDSAEFAEWLAFRQIYGPIGVDRGDYHAAQIDARMCNMFLPKNKKAATITDCLIQWGRKAKQSVKEMGMLLESYFRTMGIKKRE